MDTRTASPPNFPDTAAIVTDHDHPLENEPLPDKISAYYSLVFPNFTYYLQTLTVTIGRRCIPNSTPSSSEQAQVDVDLGPLKSVSRLHAKIEYADDEERFVLVVLGRNGAWVDGAWSGKGSRVPLGERSQIQIASRTFHFVLPPPPAPEDSPSPSSQSSLNRPRSPSVDITSLSPPSSIPSVSPPPAAVSPPRAKAHPLPDLPQLPNSNAIASGRPKHGGKKRKISEIAEAQPPPPKPKSRPKPEEMPPKPTLTYSVLCYRAIKAMGGKATLQEILTWMMDNYDWYRYNEKTTGWEKSVRHNLSSNRAFNKLERSAGEKGKGYYWAVDEQCEQMFEEQEARAAMNAAGSGSKDSKAGVKKAKATATSLDPPLKRSVRGEPKSGPFTSTPLAFRTAASPLNGPAPTAASPPLHAVKAEPSPASSVPPAPVATGNVPVASASHAPTPIPVASASTESSPSAQASATSSIPSIPPSVILPIIVGPVPSSHPSASAPASSAAPSSTPHLSTPPIVLHDNQLILNPTIFSHLTAEQLRDLEALGAQKALEILQGHIVRFLKERIRGEAGRGRGRGRAKRGRGGAGAGGRSSHEGTPGEGRKEKVPTSGPFTTAPLLSRTQPPPLQPLQTTPIPVPLPAPPPQPAQAPMAVDTAPSSPILVVDDDPADGPVPKRRKIEVGVAVGAVSG